MKVDRESYFLMESRMRETRTSGLMRGEPASAGSSTLPVQNSYDLNGNRTNIVYPGGLIVSYEFGADNRLESVTTKYTNDTKTVSFGYDTAGRMNAMSYPNGVNSTFGYDAESRMTSIKHGSFVDRTIERNVLGFKKTESIDAGIQPTVPTTQRSIKTHNDADQLTFERVQTSVTNWTEIDYLYNDNGGLDTVMPANEASTSYTYDYDNRLESVGSMTSSTEYLYDASGARIARIAGVSPALSTNYFVVDYVDGLKRPLAETDAAGNITRYYVWSGASLLCHIEADGTTRYYHADELGSTLALTDESGNVTDEFAYMPYGYATHSGTNSTPFQWLGGYGVYYDADTDLHLTLHRAYSSKLKRFISPDPLGIDGFANMYAYGDLNPAYFVDPMGLAVLLEAHPVIKFTVPSGSPMSFSFQPPTQVSINHSKITIIPENQDAYRNHPHFENKLSDGRRFATLGAGPANGIPSFGAVLDSNPNRKKDRNRNRNVFSTPVSFPNGVTEDQYIQTLFNADRAYSDNESYYLFPKNDPGYNSNSYASGLLNATGGTVGQRPPNAPGYGKPLPFRNFSSGRSTGNFGPRIGK